MLSNGICSLLHLMACAFGGTVEEHLLPSWCPNRARSSTSDLRPVDILDWKLKIPITDDRFWFEDRKLYIRGIQTATVLSVRAALPIDGQREPSKSNQVANVLARFRRNAGENDDHAAFKDLQPAGIVVSTRSCFFSLVLRPLGASSFQFAGWLFQDAWEAPFVDYHVDPFVTFAEAGMAGSASFEFENYAQTMRTFEMV